MPIKPLAPPLQPSGSLSCTRLKQHERLPEACLPFKKEPTMFANRLPSPSTGYLKTTIALILLFTPHIAHANHDDTRELLQDNRQQTQHRQHRQNREHTPHTTAEQLAQSPDYIAHQGQLYRVGESQTELEAAIHHALNLQQWHKATQLIERYRQLPQHNPALIHLVNGLTARAQNQLHQAISELTQAQQLDPNHARIGLELARALSENKQDRQAQIAFTQVLQHPLPETTHYIAQGYLKHIAQRNQWHGSLSLGIGHNDNINQSSGEQRCTFMLAGTCLVAQRLDAPLSSAIWRYSAVVQRNQSLYGNHRIKIRALAYGSHYRQNNRQNTQTNYGNDLAAIATGYAYSDAQNDFSLMPQIEYQRRGGKNHHHSIGIETEYSRQMGQRWRMTLDANTQQYRHSHAAQTHFADYRRHEINFTAEYTITAQTGAFLRVGYSRQRYAEAAASSRDATAQIGLYHAFNKGAYFNALILHRRSQYDAPSALLSDGARRADRQILIQATLGLRHWQIGGFYPEWRYKHNRVASNSVLYRYRQNEWLLSMKRDF